jgi:hypothetical protein
MRGVRALTNAPCGSHAARGFNTPTLGYAMTLIHTYHALILFKEHVLSKPSKL